jgi:hypothetical protein
MIDEEFFMSLPPDSAEAFPIYERHVREKCFPAGWEKDPESTYERDYINLMLAFINYYKLDIGISPEIPPTDNDFWAYYHHAKRMIEYHAARFTLQRLDRKKSGVAGIYVLTPTLRQEIHHYIARIRETMNGISLPETKREALFNKLNAFAAEVDRDRTRIEAIASAYIWLKREVREGVEILKPVLGQVERILDKFAKAKELPEALPPPRRGGEIEGPRKELPAPNGKRTKDDFDDLDDDIPF